MKLLLFFCGLAVAGREGLTIGPKASLFFVVVVDDMYAEYQVIDLWL